MHPYKLQPDRSFWSRAFGSAPSSLFDLDKIPLISSKTDRIMSAGSCFAANMVPYIEQAGFSYLRTECLAEWLCIPAEAMSYGAFSAAYGNVYTSTQLLQLLRRCFGTFEPEEDRWIHEDRIVDPYRPGLRYVARSEWEFELITRQHLTKTREAFLSADVFIFTLGLTETWVAQDGAVFPVCPGTVAGTFDDSRHRFINFSAATVTEDLRSFISELREVNQDVRVILTVSPVPLVATATGKHVAVANSYSKSVLRIAAEHICSTEKNVFYFPAYEIVIGSHASSSFFQENMRSISDAGVNAVMTSFLGACGIETDRVNCELRPVLDQHSAAAEMSAVIVAAECEEAAVEY